MTPPPGNGPPGPGAEPGQPGTPDPSAPAPDAAPSLPPAPRGVRGRIVALAASQLGYHDFGSYCTKYGPCELWCALFATWVWQGANIPIGSLPFTGSVYDWAALNTYVLRPAATPRPGDTVLFGSGPSSVDTSLHIGIVEDVYPGYLVTIEGDTRHRVLRYVVPIRNPKRIGEPGRIYAYASPLRRASAAVFPAAATLPIGPPLTAAQLRQAIANQDLHHHRLSLLDRRLIRTIRALRAFQHMPYRAGDVQIEWTGVDKPSGKIRVAVVSAGPLAAAQTAWSQFLARYGDSGGAYIVGYYHPRP